MADSENTINEEMSNDTLHDLYRIEGLFNAIRLISDGMVFEGLVSDDMENRRAAMRAVESILYVSEQGVEFCSKTARKLDMAAMKANQAS